MSNLKPADALKQHQAAAPLGPPASPPALLATDQQVWRSRGYLPHCDSAQLIQHIVFGLADALPKNVKPPSAMHSDRLLDAGRGECILRHAPCAAAVQQAILRGDGSRYRLLAWCIMPNHAHVVIEHLPDVRLSDIVQAWKSASAHAINKLLDRHGAVWRREYFDRFMRDDDHLAATVAYVEENPVKAGLVVDAGDWLWSSASRVQRAGEDAGGPR